MIEERLSAGYAYAVQKTFALFYVGKKAFFGYFVDVRRAQNERGVVAKRATEIATAHKNRAGKLFGVIEKSGFLKTAC